MGDATPTAAVQDQIIAVDIDWMHICPKDQIVSYSLAETWQSGKITIRNGTVKVSDFAACAGSFCQATPKRKFLNWLVTNGYEQNLTVA